MSRVLNPGEKSFVCTLWSEIGDDDDCAELDKKRLKADYVLSDAKGVKSWCSDLSTSAIRVGES